MWTILYRDHDEEFNVIDAAKKLNEVQSMKGLGRYFKQVAQSARPRIKGGDVDDFLGCITVPIKVSEAIVFVLYEEIKMNFRYIVLLDWRTIHQHLKSIKVKF